MEGEENGEEEQGEAGGLDEGGDPAAGAAVDEVEFGEETGGDRAEEEAEVVDYEEREVLFACGGLFVHFVADESDLKVGVTIVSDKVSRTLFCFEIEIQF